MSPLRIVDRSATAGQSRFAPPDRAPLELHRRLPGYAATPLVELPVLAAELGVGRLLVKDESSRLELPSFKMLGASWAVYRSLQERVGEPLEPWSTVEELAAKLEPYRPLALAAATDGNHGRAVARMARLLGLEARIFVPAGTSAARIAAIESEGAACAVVSGTYDDAVRRSAEEASSSCLVISDTSWPGYATVPARVIEGYSTIFSEAEEQLRGLGVERTDAVFVPVGVGALAAATARYWLGTAGSEQPPMLVSVEPVRAACVLESVVAGHLVTVPGPHDSIMAGLNCGIPSEVAWPVVSAAYALFLAIDDEPVRDAMRRLAAAGLTAGETGAAALAGLAELLGDDFGREVAQRRGIGPSSTVLVLLTEGATDPVAYSEIVGADACARAGAGDAAR